MLQRRDRKMSMRKQAQEIIVELPDSVPQTETGWLFFYCCNSRFAQLSSCSSAFETWSSDKSSDGEWSSDDAFEDERENLSALVLTASSSIPLPSFPSAPKTEEPLREVRGSEVFSFFSLVIVDKSCC